MEDVSPAAGRGPAERGGARAAEKKRLYKYFMF
jgi:hypothetical protein